MRNWRCSPIYSYPGTDRSCVLHILATLPQGKSDWESGWTKVEIKMQSDQVVSGLKLFLHDNSTYHQIKVVALGLNTVSLAILSLFQAFCKVQCLKPLSPSLIICACLGKEFKVSQTPLAGPGMCSHDTPSAPVTLMKFLTY